MFQMLQSRHNLYGEIEENQDDDIEDQMSEKDHLSRSNDSFTKEFYQKVKTNK